MKRILNVLLALTFFAPAFGQELNCKVQVVSPQIQGTTEKRIFENLQKDIYEFMNNRKWTNDVFSLDERIECTFFINVTEKISNDEFKGSIQIQATRPVYKSSYSSLLLNYNDNDFQFRYVEFQSLDFSLQQHMSNLTAVLGYYAYLIIGLDYDSYSLNGGSPWYQKCQTIVANAQTAPERGWKSFEGTKNRYWLVDNLLNTQFSSMRECMYKYHRLGFDLMHQDVNTGRAAVLDALQLLKKVHQAKPLSFNMQVFFNAKSDEVVKLFSGGMPDEKAKATQLLNEIDPGNGSKYLKIQQN
ncbi:MAG: hypothetical protein FD123_3306 [Bacteroidetes bacterium]|nr:MAG: hypothetical protein FD123_3306 [Bacteroidota bacterium]